MSEFFTRETWRASKRRKMQKRVNPYGGQKVAPPAFLEAAKRTHFQKGHANHRICQSLKKDGTPCRMLAFKELKVCGAHGGFRARAKRGVLKPSGRTAARQAEYRAKMQAGQSPMPDLELVTLQAYQQANEWTRKRLARAWQTPAWPQLIQTLKTEKKIIGV